MDTPSRRNFFACAVGATLAPFLRASGESSRNMATKPLVIDVMGPMAYRWSGSNFEIWMPDLSSIRAHQAGITTEVTSFELTQGNYQIKGPGNYGGQPSLWQTQKGQVYLATTNDTSAPNRYIYISLPMPHSLAVLDPVLTRIYPTGQNPPSTYTAYAVGLRLFYGKAGVPTLYDSNGLSGLVPNGIIPFDSSPDEIETYMSLGYDPYDRTDPGHAESKQSFNLLSKLFKLDLQVDFDASVAMQAKADRVALMGPHHDCLAPAIRVS
jgi:hypothetical protein